jgi:phage terminase large subunit
MVKRKKKRDYQHNPMDLSQIELPMQIEGENLDEWQKEVLNYWGNIAIRSGRQVGKSAIMAKKAAHAAIKWEKTNILVTAASERQAAYIFEKIKFEFRHIKDNIFAETPTMRKMLLKNGSIIYCLPTGITGDLIRGLTIDVWIPDEAAYINDAVWAAVTPMLWIKKKQGKGWIWALSTPCGKQGRFYNLFENEEFKTWHVSSEECERIPKDELERWKKNYTRVQYCQEVLGEFIDEVSRLFTEELLKKCFKKGITANSKCKFLGVDVARFGGDKNAFVEDNYITELKKHYINFAETTDRVGINETYWKILEKENQKKYNKILIDDGGVGGGLTDFLKEKLKNKIIAVNNASRSLDTKRTKKILKEDLYSFAIMKMEDGKVLIEDNDELYLSLSTMQFEYNDNSIKIYGRNSHLAEAFVRAIWGEKTKSLNVFARSF